MRSLLVSLFGSLIFSGGPAKVETAPQPQPQPQPVCVAVHDIGALPLTVSVGRTQVRFTEWMAKDADAQELIGFRAAATGMVSFVVRAGGEDFAAEGSEWINPHGVVGARVHGIDSLTVCALP
jgi:hypothetical protein